MLCYTNYIVFISKRYWILKRYFVSLEPFDEILLIVFDRKDTHNFLYIEIVIEFELNEEKSIFFPI